MTSSIQTNHLYFAYDEEDTLQDINITIEGKNGCILLAGTNGSGKSTLLNVLCGFLIPYRGTLERTMPIAYLPFESPLFPQLTVKEKRHIFIRKKVWQPIGMSCYNSSWSFGLTENHPHFCLPGVKKINCPARKQTGSEK